MSTRTIICQVQNEYVKGAGVPVGAAGSHNDVVLEITFSELWEGLTKKITWLDANGENPTLTILTTDMLKIGETLVYLVPIPAEPKAVAGDMTMTIKGVTVSGTIETRATLSTSCTFKVLSSDYDSSADASTDINATQAALLQAEIDRIIHTISNAEASATAAEASKVAASASANVAVSVKEAADSAKIAAETARDTAIAAKTDAVAAKTTAESAQTTAETAKTQAQTSATNALSSASSAAVSEHNAQVWAVGGTLETGEDILDPLPLQDGAQQYAQKALASKAAAEMAKASAEAAQSGAEAAKGVAESSVLSAQTAQAAAEAAKAGAIEAQTGAENAQTAAESAKTDAQAARTQAETASTTAQDSKTVAEAAKTAAEIARTGAETAQGAAESAVVEAQTAKTAAVTAKTDAVAAKIQAETARTAAQGAQAGAEAAKLSVEGIENLAESWAVGGTGGRDGEDVNNARYWSQQAQAAAGGGVISFNGRAGGVMPQMGDYTAAQVGADPEGSAEAVQTALAEHESDASAHIISGTLGGQAAANAGAQESLGVMQVRNISAGTADLTAGVSALATGQIYLVYEA
ncbi:MAG: hypothetical protein VB078_06920 [Clostridiaceae bacterium]|nr:hypothetical protein [Clostridiaceae bacterium]